MTVCEITNFSIHFETAESRKRAQPMEWVKMRTKHDGRSYRRVAEREDAVEALCGWYLLLQVAAKMPVRGFLADLDGPLNAEDCAYKTGMPETIFETAFKVLSEPEIGWIELREWDETLDFWQNCDRLRITPGANVMERHALAPSGTAQQSKKRHRPPPATAANHSPANDGNGHSPADNGTHQHAAAGSGLDKITQEDIRVPLAVPQKGEQRGDDLNFDQAKSFLSELFGREKRKWSREEDGLLADNVPIPRRDTEMIAAWFRLPADHPIFNDRHHPHTIRKQELTTYLRDFPGEGDKMRAFASFFFKPVNGQEKKEPPRWQEVFRWLNGEDVVLPDSFWKLDLDLQREYERNWAAFVEATKTVAAA